MIPWNSEKSSITFRWDYGLMRRIRKFRGDFPMTYRSLDRVTGPNICAGG